VDSIALAVLWGSGGTLQDRVLRGERVTNGMAEKWLAGCAACLAALHRRGLCAGRLDSKGVSLFPPRGAADPAGAKAKAKARGGGSSSAGVPTGPPQATRRAVPDAKVTDLSRVGPLPPGDVALAAVSSDPRASALAAALFNEAAGASPEADGAGRLALPADVEAASQCPWTLRELVWSANALPPGYADLDDADGERGRFEDGPALAATPGAPPLGEVGAL
jgi:hypothetical protein